jgi:hypothetical protein
MPNFVHILLRILAGIAGALLLYVAIFLYEDEEARLQNRLEEIWQRINEVQSRAFSREAAFLYGVTRATRAILDRLMGPELLSLQSIAVSAAFSVASFSLYWLSLITRSKIMFGEPFILPSQLALYCCVPLLFVVGTLPALVRRENYPGVYRFLHTKTFACLLIVLAAAFPWVTMVAMARSIYAEWLLGRPMYIHTVALIVIAPGVLADIVFIAFFRWMLNRVSQLTTLSAIIPRLALVVAILGILVGPSFLDKFPILDRPLSPVLMLAKDISQTNLVDGLCLLLLIAVMVFLVLHRLLWPFIKRPINAANRKGLIKNTKLLGALGTMLLLYAFPDNPIVKWVTHFLPNLKGG